MMVESISDLNDLLQASEEVLAAFQHQPWWRGHGVESWKLVPNVHRADHGDAYESAVAHGFTRRAPTRHAKCPRSGDLARWLFLGEHYGLPTRLLDWTESPLVAAFFSTWEEEYSERDGAIWALDPFALNDVTISEFGLCQPGHPQVDRLVKLAFSYEPATDNSVVAILTEEVDLRMMVQLSGFTIHGSPTPLESRESLSHLVQKFAVPQGAKEKLRVQLESLGVRERTVFPDLEHLSRDLTRDRY